MSSWIQRVSAVFGGQAAVVPAPHGQRAPARVRAAGPAPAAPIAAAELDLRVPFFEWLLGAACAPVALLGNAEQPLLVHLDGVLASDTAVAALLPRAPAVIPQLLGSLRDPSQSADALARRVAKDAQLVAEVIRLANGALMRATAPVTDLPQAIERLGTEGLRRAIARVVLKPIFDAPADSLSGRAAARLWLHSEAQAAECMRLAAAAGIDPFEGYLAGLLHNIGWSAALRALDGCASTPPAAFSHAFVHALQPRRDTAFARLVGPWQLTDAATSLAGELLESRPVAARSPLARALLAADRAAALEVLGARVAVAGPKAP